MKISKVNTENARKTKENRRVMNTINTMEKAYLKKYKIRHLEKISKSCYKEVLFNLVSFTIRTTISN